MRRRLLDTGLAGGIPEPLPPREGNYTQGPFTYAMPRRWRCPAAAVYPHDPRGALTAMDFAPDPVELSSIVAEHVRLSTSPQHGEPEPVSREQSQGLECGGRGRRSGRDRALG